MYFIKRKSQWGRESAGGWEKDAQCERAIPGFADMAIRTMPSSTQLSLGYVVQFKSTWCGLRERGAGKEHAVQLLGLQCTMHDARCTMNDARTLSCSLLLDPCR